MIGDDDNDPSFGDGAPPLGGGEPSFGGTEPSFGDSEPSFGGTEPSFGGTEPSFGGTEPDFGGAEGGLPTEAAAGGPVLDPAADGQPIDRRKKAVLSVPIEVIVTVGRARPMLADLVKLNRDSLLTLNSKIEDPVEIMIGEKVIARGELQELEDDSGRLGVRLTEVADLTQSL